MSRAHAQLLAVGALLAGLGVAFGALGAHALAPRLTEHELTIFETGARYQLIHGVAVVLCAALADRIPRASLAGWLLALGAVLFSGSLYGLALTHLAALGPVTPLGGVSFIAGWLVLAVSALGAAKASPK